MSIQEVIKYLSDKTSNPHLTTSYVGVNWREVYNRAIEALEKQISKHPPKHDATVCPVCNSKANYGHPYTYYCCHCGQRIDWSEEGDTE